MPTDKEAAVSHSDISNELVRPQLVQATFTSSKTPLPRYLQYRSQLQHRSRSIAQQSPPTLLVQSGQQHVQVVTPPSQKEVHRPSPPAMPLQTASGQATAEVGQEPIRQPAPLANQKMAGAVLVAAGDDPYNDASRRLRQLVQSDDDDVSFDIEDQYDDDSVDDMALSSLYLANNSRASPTPVFVPDEPVDHDEILDNHDATTPPFSATARSSAHDNASLSSSVDDSMDSGSIYFDNSKLSAAAAAAAAAAARIAASNNVSATGNAVADEGVRSALRRNDAVEPATKEETANASSATAGRYSRSNSADESQMSHEEVKQQRLTRAQNISILQMCLCVICVIAIASAIVLAITLTRDGPDTKNDSNMTTVSTVSPVAAPSPMASPSTTIAPLAGTAAPIVSVTTSPSYLRVTLPPTAPPSVIRSFEPTLVRVPTPAPALSAEQALQRTIADASPDDGAALNVSGTPQSLAFEWLTNSSDVYNMTTSRQIQRYALAVVFFSTKGDTWANKSGWLADETECNWYSRGTLCTNGIITNLALGLNDVSGKLPAEVAMLSDLSVLSILGGPTRTIQGTMPSTLGLLRNLTELCLATNDLTGTLPSEFGNLPMLRVLDVSGNHINGTMPETYNQLLLLQTLALSDNALAGPFPTQVTGLSELQTLTLGSNQLTGVISRDIAWLAQLRSLALEDNHFTALPSEIGLLTNLQRLSVFLNQLRGTMPTDLGRMTGLQVLLLAQNQFNGTIPESFGKLINVRELDLSFNSIGGTIPSVLGNMTSLMTLLLDHNQLGGGVPDQLGNLRKIDMLRVDHNDLTVDVSERLCVDFMATAANLTFYADCLPGTSLFSGVLGGSGRSELNCSCCTYCCNDSTDICNGTR